MIARTLLLVAAGLVFMLVAGLPARHLAGDQAMVQCLAATALCLVPGVLALAWVGWATRHDPRQASLMLLGASGVRMFGVLGVAVLLYFQGPWFQGQDGFLFWVLGAYLVLLAVEVMLTVRPPQARPIDANNPQG